MPLYLADTGLKARYRPQTWGDGSSTAPGFNGIQTNGWRATYGVPGTFSTPEAVPLSRKGWTAASVAASQTVPTTISESLLIPTRVRKLYPLQASLTDTDVALNDWAYSTDALTGSAAGKPNNSVVTSPLPVARWITPDRTLVGNSISGEIIAFHRNARAGQFVPCIVVRATDGTTTVTTLVSSWTTSTSTTDQEPLDVFAWTLNITSLATGMITVDCKVFPFIGDATSILDSATVLANGGTAREFTSRYYLKNVTRAANPPLAYVSNGGSDTTHAGWSTTASTAAAAPYATIAGAMNDMFASANTAVTGGIADGCRLRISAVTGGAPTGSITATRPQNVAEMVIERDPAATKTTAIINLSSNFRARMGVTGLTSPLTEGRIRFTGVSIARTGTATLFGETATLCSYVFDDVNFDNGTATGNFLSSAHISVYGCVATGTTTNSSLFLKTGVNETRILRGLKLDKGNQGLDAWCTIGCEITRNAGVAHVDPLKGAVFYNNKCLNPYVTSGGAFGIDSGTVIGGVVEGVVVWGNLFEVLITGGGPVMRCSADNPAHGSTKHVMIGNNTTTGYVTSGRHNIFYDWQGLFTASISGTTMTVTATLNSANIQVGMPVSIAGAVLGTVTSIITGGPISGTYGLDFSATVASTTISVGELRDHTLFLFAGEIASQLNNKGDIVSASNFAQGAYAFTHGVGCQGNWTQWQVNSPGGTEDQFFAGIGSNIGTSQTTRNDPGFTTYAGATASTGAGGGNYVLTGGGGGRGIVTKARTAHDLAGTARPTTNDAAGAYA